MSPKGTSERRAGRWWLGPVIVYLCFFATLILIGLILALIPIDLIEDPRVAIATEWTAYAVPLAIVYLYVRRYEGRKNFWSSVGVRRENFGRSFLWLLALLVVFSFVLVLYWTTAGWVVGADPGKEMEKYLERAWPDWYFAYFIPAAFMPVAFSEELIFRGFVLDRFLVRGKWFALVASSLMFSSLHLWYLALGTVGLTLFGGAFIIAIFWGIVYCKTRNIAGLVFHHGLVNAMVSVEYFWGLTPVIAVNAIVLSAGMACLGYLILNYLRRRLGK